MDEGKPWYNDDYEDYDSLARRCDTKSNRPVPPPPAVMMNGGGRNKSGRIPVTFSPANQINNHSPTSENADAGSTAKRRLSMSYVQFFAKNKINTKFEGAATPTPPTTSSTITVSSASSFHSGERANTSSSSVINNSSSPQQNSLPPPSTRKPKPSTFTTTDDDHKQERRTIPIFFISSLFRKRRTSEPIKEMNGVAGNGYVPHDGGGLRSTVGPVFAYGDLGIEHRCCCRCCHVRMGAIAIGLVELLAIVYQLVHTALLHTRLLHHHPLSLALTLVGLLLGCAAVALLFVGIFTGRPMLLVPHMLMQGLAVLVLLAMASLCAVGLLTGSAIVLRIINATDDQRDVPINAFGRSSTNPDHLIVTPLLTYIIIVTLIIFVLGSLIQTWLLLVVYWCFRYLRGKNAHEKLYGGQMNYSPSVNGAVNGHAVQIDK